MTKTEKRMKGFIEENSLECIDGIWVTWIAEGSITVGKERKEFTLDFKETGFKKRGEIFSESDIAPHFDELYLQMLPARFDMILRVCGSLLVRKLNEMGPRRDKLIVSVKHGIGVQNNRPVSCPHIDLQSWGYEGAKSLEDEIFQEVAEIMAENLNLLTDSFLRELKHVAETAPEVSDTIPDISNLH